jgi:hypothetical protein
VSHVGAQEPDEDEGAQEDERLNPPILQAGIGKQQEPMAAKARAGQGVEQREDLLRTVASAACEVQGASLGSLSARPQKTLAPSFKNNKMSPCFAVSC